MKLFHFTSSAHGITAIRDQKFKLATLNNLNDPFELHARDLRDPMIRKAILGTKKMLSEHMALLCCSKNWHSTLLWSHYGDKHKGVALELTVKPNCVNHVDYRHSRTPITRQEMDEMMQVPDGKGMGGELLRLKSHEWAYEDEARVFFNLKNVRSVDGLYFAPFNDLVSLTGVILGPLCTATDDELQKALPAGLSISVTRTRTAFRSFRIVRDKRFAIATIAGT